MTELEIVTLSGRDVLEELERALQEVADTGFHPILLGDTENYEQIQEGMEDARDPQVILSNAAVIALPDWFGKRREMNPDLYLTNDGDWPVDSANEDEMGIVTHLDLQNYQPKREVLVLNAKVPAAWCVFAELNWGGWNDCPSPEEHCAVHRYWAQQYGADVISVTGDVVQCVVARPPTDRASALALAQQQYAYSPDIVDQGTQSIAALAAGLMNSKYWYFWWD